jgi:hypothetical protein
MTTSPFLSTVRRLAASALVAGLVTGTALAAAPAAHAYVTSFYASAYSITVGAPVTLTAYSNSPLMGASVQFSVNGNPLATVAVTGGQAQLVWTPPAAGTYTVTANDGQSSNSFTVTVTAVSTQTVSSSPNTAQIGVPVPITVTVTSASPSNVQPQGSVTFFQTNGAPLATVALSATGNPAQTYATVSWTPTVAGQVAFYALYNPAAGAPTLASQSQVDSFLVTATGTSIALHLPPTYPLGTPAVLTANVAPGITGNVVFLVNNAAVSPAVAIANGTASYPWTPTAAGQTTVQAQLNSSNPAQNTTVTDIVTVQGSTNQDVIYVSSPGKPVLSQTTALLMANGQTIQATGTTLSGAAVTFAVASGQCTFAANVLTAQSGSGICHVTATSAGGNGYGPVTQGYTINLTPGKQNPKVTPDKSGTVKAGTNIYLEKAGLSDTNAGQNVTWRVTSGASLCKVQYPASGAAYLHTSRTGTCTVKGTAPAVPGQWSALTITRTYRVR